MTIVVAIVNTKGGVGKSTLTSNLARRAAEDSARVGIYDTDPQGTLKSWGQRRHGAVGQEESFQVFSGVDDIAEGIDRLDKDGWDWIFIDSPPAFINHIEEILKCAHFAVIPMRPSLSDIEASEDAVILARRNKVEHAVVMNDIVGSERTHLGPISGLKKVGVPMFKTSIKHRAAYAKGMNSGKVASETGGRGATDARKEIDGLWHEIKAASIKAFKSARGGRND